MSFAITVLPAVGGHRWVCVEGRVDATTADDVRAVLRTAVCDLPTRSLTVDLRRAAVADDAGRQCVAEAAAVAVAAGVAWQVVEPVAPDATVAPRTSLALAAG
ncbi:hypothetical protein AB0368_19535 [Actinoplanes sp. NPDC051475]|uniref:hypothetical protein n=1 Tax=Actinoplanes sp. NPDC051475 TaxID=3157225 RepID=UPI00344D0D6B